MTGSERFVWLCTHGWNLRRNARHASVGSRNFRRISSFLGILPLHALAPDWHHKSRLFIPVQQGRPSRSPAPASLRSRLTEAGARRHLRPAAPGAELLPEPSGGGRPQHAASRRGALPARETAPPAAGSTPRTMIDAPATPKMVASRVWKRRRTGVICLQGLSRSSRLERISVNKCLRFEVFRGPS